MADATWPSGRTSVAALTSGDEPLASEAVCESSALLRSSLTDWVCHAPLEATDAASIFLASLEHAPDYHPAPSKQYALKVLYVPRGGGEEGGSGSGSGSAWQAGVAQHAAEWKALAAIPAHANVISTWCVLSHALPPVGTRVDTLPATLQVLLSNPPLALRTVLGASGAPLDASGVLAHVGTLLVLVSDYYPSTLQQLRATLPTPLPHDQLMRLALDLAAAVAHINECGVVHTDLHPGNILVATDGRFVLADFGSAVLASRASDMSVTLQPGSSVGGAPAFLAPELVAAATALAAGTPVRVSYAKADVWGLGSLLYWAAYGKLPWMSYGAPGTSDALSDMFVNAPVFGAEYRQPFVELMRWCLMPTPSQRIGARALHRRLQSWVAGGEPRALPFATCPWLLSHDVYASPTRVLVNKHMMLSVCAPSGACASVPVQVEPTAFSTPSAALPAAVLATCSTFQHVLDTAHELLSLPGDAARWSLVYRGHKVDAKCPVMSLPRVLTASRLYIVDGIADQAPSLTVAFATRARGLAPPEYASATGLVDVSPAVSVPAGAASGTATPVSVTSGGGRGGEADRAPRAAGAAAAASMPTASDRATPGLTFSAGARDRPPSIALLENNTMASTRDKWGTLFVNQAAIMEATHASRYAFSVKITDAEPGAGCAVGFAHVETPDAATTSSLRPFDATRYNLGAHPGSWGYSKTGKISNGRSDPMWEDYGEPFGVGDVITVELDQANQRLRFYKNGVCQGVAFDEPEIKSASLRPAVCLGSNMGGRLVTVQLVSPEARTFDRAKSHHRLVFSPDLSTVINQGKWATAQASHAGVHSGKMQWVVRLDETRHGAGVAVGVVSTRHFDWEKQNLGASPNSWCFSKTGKKGDGGGFVDYGRPFSSSDVITMNVDMDARTLSFMVNGDDQGIAFDASSGFGSTPIVPAVCLGSTEGGKLARVSILSAYAPIRRFHRFARSAKVELSDFGTTCSTEDRWGTVFLDTPPVNSGKMSFGVLIESAGSGCGAGVGFADATLFAPTQRNLGASDGSWCYSKTGKRSNGVGQFVTYGEPFKTGDVITAEVDFDLPQMRFYLNGRDQGLAYDSGFADRSLVPAVVLGSTDGGHLTRLRIVPPAVTRFDVRRANKHVQMRMGDRAAFTDSRWCSCLADHPGEASGIVRFAVRVEGDGGAAFGFVNANTFRPYMHNLGAFPETWALSKTGKKSAGDAAGFSNYAERISSGDVVGCEANLRDGTIRFWRQGAPLGVAFSDLQGRGLRLVPAVCIGSNTGGRAATVTLVPFDPSWM